MMLKYEPIGNYIHQIDNRNVDLCIDNLVGLTIEKKYIKSVANIIGTDLSKYKIIKNHQFSCSLMQVSRDGKMPVAMYKGEPAIMSPAYPIFEINDENKVMPEYLHMYFSRSEFDREAVFYAVGGVRGSLEWDDFCNIKIPVPPIEEQRRIVAEYQTVERRIANNEAMIQRLEETAQAIYHHTFVEGIDENILPKGWRKGRLEDVTLCFDNLRKPVAGYERNNKPAIYPYYGATSILDYVDEYIFDGEYILMGEDGSVVDDYGKPVLQYVRGKSWINNHAHVLQGKGLFSNCILYWTLRNTTIQDYITGAVQLKLNQKNMNSIPVIIPNNVVLEKIQQELKPINDYIYLLEKEISTLSSLKSLLTSKIS